MNRRGWIASSLLLLTVVSTAGGLALWQYASFQAEQAASAAQPEPVESVTVARAQERIDQSTTTSIGTS